MDDHYVVNLLILKSIVVKALSHVNKSLLIGFRCNAQCTSFFPPRHRFRPTRHNRQQASMENGVTYDFRLSIWT